MKKALIVAGLAALVAVGGITGASAMDGFRGGYMMGHGWHGDGNWHGNNGWHGAGGWRDHDGWHGAEGWHSNMGQRGGGHDGYRGDGYYDGMHR